MGFALGECQRGIRVRQCSPLGQMPMACLVLIGPTEHLVKCQREEEPHLSGRLHLPSVLNCVHRVKCVAPFAGSLSCIIAENHFLGSGEVDMGLPGMSQGEDDGHHKYLTGKLRQQDQTLRRRRHAFSIPHSYLGTLASRGK